MPASEAAAAEGMEAHMVSLIDVLRTRQSRAKSSSHAALEQQRLAGDLEAHAKKFTAQGRIMSRSKAMALRLGGGRKPF